MEGMAYKYYLHGFESEKKKNFFLVYIFGKVNNLENFFKMRKNRIFRNPRIWDKFQNMATLNPEKQFVATLDPIFSSIGMIWD